MNYRNIVILTGAGVSAESGVRTFRDNDGLWENHRVEDVCTPEAFARDPELVQKFYNARRAQLPIVKPNPAHLALGRLEAQWPGEVTLVTQNVDDLHERGGSKQVIHMHGQLNKIRCTGCHAVSDWFDDCGQASVCPACGRAGFLRPHIVWFGEMPMHMQAIQDKLAECDLFISIGTSGNVYPAAGFVSEVRAIGQAHTLEVNLEPGMSSAVFAEHRHGRAGELVPVLVDELLAKKSEG